MKAFAIELPDEVVAWLMDLYQVKTTAEIRNILQLKLTTQISNDFVEEIKRIQREVGNDSKRTD